MLDQQPLVALGVQQTEPQPHGQHTTARNQSYAHGDRTHVFGCGVRVGDGVQVMSVMRSLPGSTLSLLTSLGSITLMRSTL